MADSESQGESHGAKDSGEHSQAAADGVSSTPPAVASRKTKPLHGNVCPSAKNYSLSTEKDDEFTAPSRARSSLGSAMSHVSDLINNNLIVARYTALASIGLLAVYGIAHTPLFFRYRTVSEIPSLSFVKRKRIRGRILKVEEHTAPPPGSNQPVLCYVRHLSPAERLMSKSWFDWFLRMHPAARLNSARGVGPPEESPGELLKIQIAGIELPDMRKPDTRQSSPSILQQISLDVSGMDPSRTNPVPEWLQQLARDRTFVSCRLIARRIVEAKNEVTAAALEGPHPQRRRNIKRTKRPIPELTSEGETDKPTEQVAVAKLFYRSDPWQLWVNADVGETMVRHGHAHASSAGLFVGKGEVVDATDSVKDLHRDVAYLEQLSRAEYEAAKGSYGVWTDPAVRERRKDVLDEVDFQENASFWRKAWRWLRGG